VQDIERAIEDGATIEELRDQIKWIKEKKNGQGKK
jgi:DNA-binding transcriptional regulator YdaS (Cro superfamily)